MQMTWLADLKRDRKMRFGRWESLTNWAFNFYENRLRFSWRIYELLRHKLSDLDLLGSKETDGLLNYQAQDVGENRGKLLAKKLRWCLFPLGWLFISDDVTQTLFGGPADCKRSKYFSDATLDGWTVTGCRPPSKTQFTSTNTKIIYFCRLANGQLGINLW